MESILNRWRGTGDLFSISKIKITGTMIYAIYIGFLFGLISIWYIGLISILLFLGAESKGFGKWVGALCYPESKIDLEKEYQDKEGYKFPYFHQIANFIVNERINFYWYCNVALFLRGLYWGSTLYLALALFEYISIVEYVFLSIAYGIGFPLGCWLSKNKSFNYKSKFISIVGKWETQEVYYGFVHTICNGYIVYKVICNGL